MFLPILPSFTTLKIRIGGLGCTWNCSRAEDCRFEPVLWRHWWHLLQTYSRTAAWGSRCWWSCSRLMMSRPRWRRAEVVLVLAAAEATRTNASDPFPHVAVRWWTLQQGFIIGSLLTARCAYVVSTSESHAAFRGCRFTCANNGGVYTNRVNTLLNMHATAVLNSFGQLSCRRILDTKVLCIYFLSDFAL